MLLCIRIFDLIIIVKEICKFEYVLIDKISVKISLINYSIFLNVRKSIKRQKDYIIFVLNGS